MSLRGAAAVAALPEINSADDEGEIPYAAALVAAYFSPRRSRKRGSATPGDRQVGSSSAMQHGDQQAKGEASADSKRRSRGPLYRCEPIPR